MRAEDNPDKPLTDGELWCLILRTWYAAYRLRQLELSRVSITVEQSSILAALHLCKGSATSEQLEDITLRQQNSISTLTNRMIKSGLVAKKKVSGEKKTRIFITEYGKKLLEDTPTDAATSVFSCLEQSEKVEFAGYLQRLRERVRELLGINYQPPFLQAITEETTTTTEWLTYDYDKGSDYALWVSLDGTGFAMSRLRQLELAKFGLTVEQSIVMMILWHRGGSITANKVGELTFRQHNSISALVNRMIKSGLISREKKAGDKSASILFTKEGKKLFNSLTYISLEMVFSSLQTYERIRFIGHLNTVHDKARGILGFPTEKPALGKIN